MHTDIIHEYGEHTEWNESFYFSFYDKQKDICGFMRIGLKPNKNEKSVFCFFMMPDNNLVGIKDNGTYDTNELSVKGLSFKMVKPERSWNITYSGMMGKIIGKTAEPVKVSFSFDYETLNDVFNYRECVSGIKEEISQCVASEHLEQFGSMKGKLVIGNNEYMINGLGERDHSWGIRDWNAPKMWIWLTAQFSENCALNVTKLVVEQGEVDAGFIHIDGTNIPLDAAKIDTIYNEDGSPRSFAMVLTDKEGKTYDVNANIIKNAMLPFVSQDGKNISVMHETLAKYEFNGLEGYGIAEYLVRKS
ncbi:hypothetical protein CUJ83_12610 [Methanocella sp. CWC-04]|uniref:Uncharacterized protein n=1 Tax=Methanooceanicella nereidis TaxID=2052831 RepID=A0AAP2RER6_9EURY|nr:hypothetical protein [Methanocella sp. CWC-04]MCD1295837.1 hypothetical protein [Methanocella sp. CWC-04]